MIKKIKTILVVNKWFSLAILIILMLVPNRGTAQERSISTAVPFLNIQTDARSAGIGGLGVASSADVFSQQWNPSKYIFSEADSGFSISYLPYAQKVSSNLFLAGLTYFKKASDKGVWGASLKYFNLGEIDLNDYLGGQVVSLGVEKPNELSLDLSYSLKLSEPFSMGITARYLRSDLGNLNENRAVNSIAFDIGAYYQSQSSDEVIFRHGAVLSNLGPRVKYSEFQTPNFIPTTLKLGTGAQFNLSDSQSLELVLEFNKLLVPIDTDADIGFVNGIFRSFSDASFQGELAEITWALGAEYKIKNNFSLRSGYYRESVEQGNLRFFSLGTGFEKNGLRLDFSYLINTSTIQNQLQNSLRLSLGVPLNFGIKQEAEEGTEEAPTEVVSSAN